MWVPIPLPYICERMIAFSIPEQDDLWVLSYEGVHRISLAPEVEVFTDAGHAEEYEIYDTEAHLIRYGGRQHRMLGVFGGTPILQHPGGDQLRLEAREERVSVLNGNGAVQQLIHFTDLSGDWAFATFSLDGRYLVIGVPYELYAFRLSGDDGDR